MNIENRLTFLGSCVIWLSHLNSLINDSKCCLLELSPPRPENIWAAKRIRVKKWVIKPRKMLCMKSRAVFNDGSQLGIIFMTDHQMPWSLRIWFWCGVVASCDIKACFRRKQSFFFLQTRQGLEALNSSWKTTTMNHLNETYEICWGQQEQNHSMVKDWGQMSDQPSQRPYVQLVCHNCWTCNHHIWSELPPHHEQLSWP